MASAETFDLGIGFLSREIQITRRNESEELSSSRSYDIDE